MNLFYNLTLYEIAKNVQSLYLNFQIGIGGQYQNMFNKRRIDKQCLYTLFSISCKVAQSPQAFLNGRVMSSVFNCQINQFLM